MTRQQRWWMNAQNTMTLISALSLSIEKTQQPIFEGRGITAPADAIFRASAAERNCSLRWKPLVIA